ncbi:hypothetical protein [Candidatus Amarobacter glycogenicus]|uniref:hypothetical protein n=1 Tax=Candidatus Amarobacter glycogenicus TaxID=3140699 RepID=UPI002A11F6BF|nr:hypothetical protein [Dehalococcoidia bacterium]
MRESSNDLDTVLREQTGYKFPASHHFVVSRLGITLPFVPLYLVATAVRVDTQRLESELSQLQMAEMAIQGRSYDKRLAKPE